jgi:uncharacterized protein (TIGR00661 family)
MKISFVIQGEGNGHLSQALKFQELLKQTEHELVSVIVSGDRKLPKYFIDEIKCDVFRIDSFQFSKTKSGNISLVKTIFKSLIKIPSINSDIQYLIDIFNRTKTELVINFYEPIMGVYNYLTKSEVRTISVANQFIINHPKYKAANKDIIGTFSFKFLNYIVGFRSEIKLTFSIDKLCDHKNIKIIPPFIKSELIGKYVKPEDFYLVYMMGDTNLKKVLKFAKKNEHIKFEVFTDSDRENTSNVIFHKSDKELFNSKILICKGVISTAGFQTLCESIYLNKPIYLIPIKNQYEQKCNAVYSYKKRLALNSYKNGIEELTTTPYKSNEKHIQWFNKSDKILLDLIKRF